MRVSIIATAIKPLKSNVPSASTLLFPAAAKLRRATATAMIYSLFKSVVKIRLTQRAKSVRM